MRIAVTMYPAAASDPQTVLNVCDLSGYVTPRLDADAPTRNNGYIKPPEGPGHGVRPDPDIPGNPTAIMN